ncbi:MAG: META domain-containing protein [Rikenellaceae bacterium]
MKIKNLALVALCAVATFISVGCCSKSLQGTTWAMVEYREKAFEREDDNSFKMIFNEDGTVSGVAGCNSFMSDVTFGEEDGSLRIVNKALTRAMCHNDVMENNFLRMLQAARKYEINGSKLSLKSGDRTLAVFEATTASEKN